MCTKYKHKDPNRSNPTINKRAGRRNREYPDLELQEKRYKAKLKGGEERINCIIELINKGEIVAGGWTK